MKWYAHAVAVDSFNKELVAINKVSADSAGLAIKWVIDDLFETLGDCGAEGVVSIEIKCRRDYG